MGGIGSRKKNQSRPRNQSQQPGSAVPNFTFLFLGGVPPQENQFVHFTPKRSSRKSRTSRVVSVLRNVYLSDTVPSV